MDEKQEERKIQVGDHVIWGEDGAGRIVYLSQDGKTAYVRDWQGKHRTVRVDLLHPARRTNKPSE